MPPRTLDQNPPRPEQSAEARALHRFEYAVYAGSAKLSLHLSCETARLWGSALGRLAYRLLHYRRRLALANIELVFPHVSSRHRRLIAYKSFEHLGAFLHEGMWAARRPVKEIRGRFEIEGEEHLRSARSSGTGLLVLAGHYGHWDLAAYPLAGLLGKLHILVRPQSNPLIRRDLDTIRQRTGHVLVARRRAAHRLLNVLRAGGKVALAIDQRVRPRQGILVPFLAHPAWTSSVPALLATATGAPALPVSCQAVEAGRYRLKVGPPILPEGRGEAEVRRLTRRYLEPLESDIVRRPELWLWAHRRWADAATPRRTAPDTGCEAGGWSLVASSQDGGR